RTERIVDRFQSARLIVEVAEIVLHEGDEPQALGHLRHADILPREHLTEIHLLALQADAATVRHGDGVLMKGIAQVFDPAIDARRARREVGGDFHRRRSMTPSTEGDSSPTCEHDDCVQRLKSCCGTWWSESQLRLTSRKATCASAKRHCLSTAASLCPWLSRFRPN